MGFPVWEGRREHGIFYQSDVSRPGRLHDELAINPFHSLSFSLILILFSLVVLTIPFRGLFDSGECDTLQLIMEYNAQQAYVQGYGYPQQYYAPPQQDVPPPPNPDASAAPPLPAEPPPPGGNDTQPSAATASANDTVCYCAETVLKKHTGSKGFASVHPLHCRPLQLQHMLHMKRQQAISMVLTTLRRGLRTINSSNTISKVRFLTCFKSFFHPELLSFMATHVRAACGPAGQWNQQWPGYAGQPQPYQYPQAQQRYGTSRAYILVCYSYHTGHRLSNYCTCSRC